MTSSTYIIDITLFVLFALAAVIFFYRKKKNFKIEGPLYLYRTKFGIKLIDWFGKKHASWLRPVQYLVVLSGYALMVFILWFLARFAYMYITSPFIAQTLKVPVIFPLIPYLPEIFKIDFLPPFYFTYWIIIIAIIAIPHEFAHGIFARLNKVRIHSTGFGFLRLFKLPTPFLAAFVEQDDKQMEKAPKFAQLSILAAGTFANVLMTILFGIIMWLFFASAFSPAGVIFNSYATSAVNVSDIDSIKGIMFDNSQEAIALIDMNESYTPIKANDINYYASPFSLKEALDKDAAQIWLYEDSPAFNAKLPNTITEINGESVKSYDDLRDTILKYRPGDIVRVTAISDEEEKSYVLALGERDGNPFLGIGIIPFQSRGILGWLYSFIAKIKDPFIYYESSIGDFGIFIYNLLWWIVIVNISVALTNMLPVGIFDGGRFFMLSVWALTGSKNAGMKAFKLVTWLILALLAALMLKWAFAVF